MKILIPTAKEMNTDLPSQPMPALTAEIRAVAEALGDYDTAGLAAFYKIKAEAAQKEAARIRNLLDGQARAYPAWQLFDGLMYRQMKRSGLSAAAKDYAAEHVCITSALYGPIGLYSPIAPHRLDFLMGLKVKGKGLKAYWRPLFDAALAQEGPILSLLSSEFETVFSKVIQDRMVKLTFMEESAGQLKVHSTISKKARGKCLNALIACRITDPEAVKALTFDGFAYRQDLSQEKKWVFVKPV